MRRERGTCDPRNRVPTSARLSISRARDRRTFSLLTYIYKVRFLFDSDSRRSRLPTSDPTMAQPGPNLTGLSKELSST